ncbi:MAG: UDP-N-acetylmuramate dehydrogenase [Nocardiopsaceae bacterium]|nr:UDP-N-acetylmuramate dehydrogenase [Nocardiopsaceae bacterium]
MTQLADYTTLGLGGPAKTFVTAASEAELSAAVSAADAAGEPVLLLGGGSNLVIADDGFDGTVIHVVTRGLRFTDAGGPLTDVTAAAGEPWDDVVARCVDAGLAGLECLSGIPGSVGATPIQNVGAYGQEVAEVITRVRVIDRRTGTTLDIPNGSCRFSYRNSLFKSGEPGRYVVTDVTFRLRAEELSRPVRYAELAAELGVETGERAPVAKIRSGVLAVRGRKGMVLDPGDPDTRSAGSFFTNPVLSREQLAHVEAAADGPVPRFDAGPGLVKVPAAWLIEHAGFAKGHGAPGPARVSSKHTLALANAGGATTADLLALAREIVAGVRDAFGVTLTPEPTLIGVTL